MISIIRKILNQNILKNNNCQEKFKILDFEDILIRFDPTKVFKEQKEPLWRSGVIFKNQIDTDIRTWSHSTPGSLFEGLTTSPDVRQAQSPLPQGP